LVLPDEDVFHPTAEGMRVAIESGQPGVGGGGLEPGDTRLPSLHRHGNRRLGLLAPTAALGEPCEQLAPALAASTSAGKSGLRSVRSSITSSRKSRSGMAAPLTTSNFRELTVPSRANSS
jgi:hypothetical protein